MMMQHEIEGGCKEHPNDKKQPGVCSSCLREKLSQLYNNNPFYYSPASPSSPKPFSSVTVASSNNGSSVQHRHLHRNASHAGDSAPCMISFSYGLNLKKSKSVAVVSRNRQREKDVNGGRGRKKDRFWSKVLKLKRKDTGIAREF